jgi:hypothetical protein
MIYSGKAGKYDEDIIELMVEHDGKCRTYLMDIFGNK